MHSMNYVAASLIWCETLFFFLFYFLNVSAVCPQRSKPMHLNLWVNFLGQESVGATESLDAHLRTILENVKLLYLLEREGGWDANQNWEDILSLGEQQRLGMVSANIEIWLLDNGLV